MKKLSFLLLSILILCFSVPVLAQQEAQPGEDGEPIDVTVKPFKMGRNIYSWWSGFNWGQDFRPNIIIASYLAEGLTNSPRWYCLSRMELEEIGEELELDASGMVRSETAVEAGNLIGARFQVTGIVSEFNLINSGGGMSLQAPIASSNIGVGFKGGGKVRVTCSVKIVDTKTSTYVIAATSSKEASIDQGGFDLAFKPAGFTSFGLRRDGGELPDSVLGKLMMSVAQDLTYQLNTLPLKKIKEVPNITGIVDYADDTSVFISTPPDNKIKKNMVFRVSRQGIIKTKAGHERKINKTIGKVRVSVVGNGSDTPSECVVLECQERIQEGDIVTLI